MLCSVVLYVLLYVCKRCGCVLVLVYLRVDVTSADAGTYTHVTMNSDGTSISNTVLQIPGK